jgi:hypothetical protein
MEYIEIYNVHIVVVLKKRLIYESASSGKLHDNEFDYV